MKRKNLPQDGFYSISQVADLLHVSTHTIRNLEREFSLEVTKDKSGNRIYTLETVEKYRLLIDNKNNSKQVNFSSKVDKSVKLIQSTPEQLSSPEEETLSYNENIETEQPVYSKNSNFTNTRNTQVNLNIPQFIFNFPKFVSSASFALLAVSILVTYGSYSLNSMINNSILSKIMTFDTSEKQIASNVLQSTTEDWTYRFDVNLPTYINSSLNVSGTLAGSQASFQLINVGQVSISETGISAPNVVNLVSTKAGENVIVVDNTDRNNPTISIAANPNFNNITVANLSGVTKLDAKTITTINNAIKVQANTDATTLEGFAAADFLRSNANTTYTGGTFEFGPTSTVKMSNLSANTFLRLNSANVLTSYDIVAGPNISISTTANSLVISASTGATANVFSSAAIRDLFLGTDSFDTNYLVVSTATELNKLHTLSGNLVTSTNLSSNIFTVFPQIDTNASDDVLISSLASLVLSNFPNLDTNATDDNANAVLVDSLGGKDVYSANTWYGYQNFSNISAFNYTVEANGSIYLTAGAIPAQTSSSLYNHANRLYFEELPILQVSDTSNTHVNKLAYFVTDASGKLYIQGTSSISLNVFESGANGQILSVFGNQTKYLTVNGDLNVSTTSSSEVTFTLNNVNSNPGTFGSGTFIPQITVNSKGQVTSVTTIATSNNYVTGISYSTPANGSRVFTLNRLGLSDLTASFSLNNGDIIAALGYTPLQATDTAADKFINSFGLNTTSTSGNVSYFFSIARNDGTTFPVSFALTPEVLTTALGYTPLQATDTAADKFINSYGVATSYVSSNVSYNFSIARNDGTTFPVSISLTPAIITTALGYTPLQATDTTADKFINSFGLNTTSTSGNVSYFFSIARNDGTTFPVSFALTPSVITTALGYVPQVNLGYTPVNKAGDTISGNLNITGSLAAVSIFQNGNSVCDNSGNCTGVGGGIIGSGDAGYLSYFTASNSIANSIIYQTSSRIGILTTNPQEALDVNGAIRLSANMGTLSRSNTLYNDGGVLYWNGQVVGVTGSTGPGGISGTQGYIPYFNTSNSLIATEFRYDTSGTQRALELITTETLPTYIAIGHKGVYSAKLGVAASSSSFFTRYDSEDDIILQNTSTLSSSDLIFALNNDSGKFLFAFGTGSQNGAVAINYQSGSDSAYLGVNNTNPSFALDVTGSARITGTLAAATFSKPSAGSFNFLSGGNFGGNVSAANGSFTNLSLANALPVIFGGIGMDSIPNNGQILIGNGAGYTLSSLISGSNISISTGAGSITINSSYVDTTNANNYVTDITFSTPAAAQRTLTLTQVGLSNLTATLSLASGDITTALGYTPLQATDTVADKFINSFGLNTTSTSGNVSYFFSIARNDGTTFPVSFALTPEVLTTALGYTPLQATDTAADKFINSYGVATSYVSSNVSYNFSIARNDGTTFPVSISLTPTVITTALGYTPVNKAGDSVSGNLIVTGTLSTNTLWVGNGASVFTSNDYLTIKNTNGVNFIGQNASTYTFYENNSVQIFTLNGENNSLAGNLFLSGNLNANGSISTGYLNLINNDFPTKSLWVDADTGNFTKRLILDLETGNTDNTTLGMYLQSIKFSAPTTQARNLLFNVLENEPNTQVDILKSGTMPVVSAGVANFYNATIAANVFSSPVADSSYFLGGLNVNGNLSAAAGTFTTGTFTGNLSALNIGTSSFSAANGNFTSGLYANNFSGTSGFLTNLGATTFSAADGNFTSGLYANNFSGTSGFLTNLGATTFSAANGNFTSGLYANNFSGTSGFLTNLGATNFSAAAGFATNFGVTNNFSASLGSFNSVSTGYFSTPLANNTFNFQSGTIANSVFSNPVAGSFTFLAGANFSGNLSAANGTFITLSAQSLNVNNLFTVDSSGSVFNNSVTFNDTIEFNAIGDLAIANDLVFTNTAISKIRSATDLTFEVGEPFNSNNFVVNLYNNGKVLLNGSTVVSGTFSAGNSTLASLILTGSFTAASGNITGNLSLGSAVVTGGITGTTGNFSGRFSIGQNTLSAQHLLMNVAPAVGATTVCRTATGLLGACSSSLEYKENVQDFTLGLATVVQLRPVSFDWKNGSGSDFGFIAEEVNAINPIFAELDASGNVTGVKYTQITALLAKGIQEQQAQITALSTAQAGVNFSQATSMYDSLMNAINNLSMSTDNGNLVFNSDIVVNGKAILNETTFTGDVSMGQMKFDTLNNDLSVLGASCVRNDGSLDDNLCQTQSLFIMKAKSGNVNIFDGKVVLKPNGDMQVEKINASEVNAAEYKVTSTSEVSGTATLTANQSEITINSTKVKSNSKIFITASNSLNGKSLFVDTKSEGSSFKVKINEAINSDVTFDWFILNVE